MLLNRIGIQTNSNQRVWIFNDVIQSVNIRNRAKVDPQKPTFGIIAAEGSFVFKDTEKRFAKYCQDGEVGTNNEVFIHLYDTITNKHQTIARLKTQRWDFDADTYTMTVTLRDDIEDLQEIEVNDTSTSIELAQLY